MNNNMNEINMNEMNMNTRQIINQLNQSHENFHHRLKRNESMNILNRYQYNTFSMNSNNNNNQINVTQYNPQYNYNIINYDENNIQFCNKNNNQNNFMNNDNIRMSVNSTNPQNNSYFNLKFIIFERNDQRKFRVKVPLSLRNNELYYTPMNIK